MCLIVMYEVTHFIVTVKDKHKSVMMALSLKNISYRQPIVCIYRYIAQYVKFGK